jgi:esterase/lipase/1-acyl-sn-glycerol-3-phosphate acyltransferase
MKRSAYFTTGFAIKALANLSKADVVIHGEDNIPSGPVVFVINHFTRIETLLIPYYIYNLTGVPAFSLASHTLFQGGLTKFFDMVGVISTRDPNRDKIILKGLLTGSENWIIFPEGRMVKTKKIMGGGEFLISHPKGRHKPHTGAASLALRAEFFRHQLLAQAGQSPEKAAAFLKGFEIESLDELRHKSASIVPVNLTYYPIRAKENIISQMAARMMKDISETMVEEIMTEGTMLLSGVDLNINFGQPIGMESFLQSSVVQRELLRPIGKEPNLSEELAAFMRKESSDMMELYMKAIYDLTTINHEHLFASFLKMYPYRKMKEMGLRRKVYFASTMICDKERVSCNLHKSLQGDQIHLLTDDRYKKVENFLNLALEKGVLKKKNGYLEKIGSKITDLLQYHRGRIDNPIKVVANEVEPIKKLQKLISSIAWQPDFLIKKRIVKSLLKNEINLYKNECLQCADMERAEGTPYLLSGSTRKIGVVLVHSYLAVPKEVRMLAEFLNSKGLWVYAPRLAGHGTSHRDLAQRSYQEWLLPVEKGYAILSNICDKVVLGGVSIGGCLALDLASRLERLAGVFAVCPPLRLKDYSTSFMPELDVWNRILARINGDALEREFFEFTSENPYVNYDKNPALGVKEVGTFLDHLQTVLADVLHPSLIVHAAKDPVVDSRGSKIIYDKLGSKKKEYVLKNYDNHVIISGKYAKSVHRLINDFVRDVTH